MSTSVIDTVYRFVMGGSLVLGILFIALHEGTWWHVGGAILVGVYVGMANPKT